MRGYEEGIPLFLHCYLNKISSFFLLDLFMSTCKLQCILSFFVGGGFCGGFSAGEHERKNFTKLSSKKIAISSFRKEYQLFHLECYSA